MGEDCGHSFLVGSLGSGQGQVFGLVSGDDLLHLGDGDVGVRHAGIFSVAVGVAGVRVVDAFHIVQVQIFGILLTGLGLDVGVDGCLGGWGQVSECRPPLGLGGIRHQALLDELGVISHQLSELGFQLRPVDGRSVGQEAVGGDVPVVVAEAQAHSRASAPAGACVGVGDVQINTDLGLGQACGGQGGLDSSDDAGELVGALLSDGLALAPGYSFGLGLGFQAGTLGALGDGVDESEADGLGICLIIGGDLGRSGLGGDRFHFCFFLLFG